jgi:hypothetical protein
MSVKNAGWPNAYEIDGWVMQILKGHWEAPF